MKRRLTLARALVNDPQIIFLDEPTTGLDPQARHVIWDRLKAWRPRAAPDPHHAASWTRPSGSAIGSASSITAP
jgi:ABC-type iron transport system FetAB ATPase subunit